MAITYYMLQIPPVWFFIVIVGSGALFAGMVGFLFRRYVKMNFLRSHNEVTGFLFLAITSFYGLFLSFIILVVWDQLNDTHGNASIEGSSAMALYRDIKSYPDSAESKQMMTIYLDFVYNVIDNEFPNMAEMKQSRITDESMNKVFYRMERFHPDSPFQIELVSQMFNHLNELSTYRGLRISSGDSEISWPLWLPILLGAVITIACAVLLDIESGRMHIALISLLGAFIGIFLFTIILLDHPFAGSSKIEPTAYLKIFTMEQWDGETRTKLFLESIK